MNIINKNFNNISSNCFSFEELTSPTLLKVVLFVSLCFAAYKWLTKEDQDPLLHNFFQFRELSKEDLPEIKKTIQLWKEVATQISEDPIVGKDTRNKLIDSKDACSSLLNEINHPEQYKIFTCYDKKTGTLQSIAVTRICLNSIYSSEKQNRLYISTLASNPTNIAKKATKISFPVKGATRFLMYNLFHICLSKPLKELSYLPYPEAVPFYSKLIHPSAPVEIADFTYDQPRRVVDPDTLKKTGYEKHLGI
ncbi:MAG: hypothetical protein JSS09_04635 [Verrucomicrobia bacterium]|nr:hypothetical protein [Verrucomicrobiota bacterium]